MEHLLFVYCFFFILSIEYALFNNLKTETKTNVGKHSHWIMHTEVLSREDIIKLNILQYPTSITFISFKLQNT